jgi:fluoride ion exporter CrcB/FEX
VTGQLLDDGAPYLLLAVAAAAGALLRVLIHRSLGDGTRSGRLWSAEAAGALGLGLLTGIPIAAAAPSAAASASLLGGALSSYAGASAFLALARTGGPGPAIGHFAATAAAGAAGAVLFGIGRLLG